MKINVNGLMNNTFDTSRITNDILDHYRLITDPLADDTLAKIISSGHEKQINKVFMTLVRSDSFDEQTFSDFEPELAATLNEYFRRTSQLPDWADASLIRSGEKVFSLYGPEIFMLLNVSSLPLCYTCGHGAKVLFETGRLMSHNQDLDPLARRLMETAQMIVDVMSPGGLAVGGKGIITIQKVRLIHASIRYFLKQGQYQNTPWDAAKYGEPINQEDLAGTLMSFAPVILAGLKRLDIELKDSETKAYMHCWKVVGYMMGVEEALLPDSYTEAFDLASKILAHQAVASDEGKALTASCISFLNNMMPGNAFDDMPGYLMDFFLKDFSASSGVDLAMCIGVNTKVDVKDKIALSLTRYVIGELGHLEHKSFIQKIVSPFNKVLLQAIIYHYNAGKAVHFNIPPSLQKDWQLVDEWNNYKTVTPEIFGNRLTWQRKTETIK